jgi:VWFA-related protein
MRRRFLLTILSFSLLTSPCVLAQRTGGGGRGTSGKGVVPAPPYIPRSPNTLSTGRTVPHADEEANLEFRSETILVQVPVVVMEKSGAHVHGLSRTDFQVLEDKKTQKIATFEEIETTSAPLTAPASHAGVFSNLTGAGEAPRRVTVVVLDTINTPFLDQVYGRKQLIKYLADKVEPGQILSLVAITSRGLKVIHGLTGDPAELIDALKIVRGELPLMQGVDIDTQAAAQTGADLSSAPQDFLLNINNTERALQDFVTNGDAAIARLQQDRAIEATMRGFLNIAWSLSGIPGRKSLVWATAGFPFYMDSPAAVPGGYLTTLYERTVQAMNDAQISVYPVDVRGLVNTAPSADASVRGAKSGSAYAQSLAARNWLQTSSLDTLKDFAEMTGGRAFYNSNDVAGGFRRAADDSSSYYLLGYYLDTHNIKPGWRQLKVKVDKSGMEVRARNGFFVTNATVNPEASHQTDVRFALASPFESTGIPVSVRWKGVSADGGKKKVEFALQVAPDGVTIYQGDKPLLDFDVDFVAVGTKDGKTADSYGQTVKGAPKPEIVAKLKNEGLAYANSLELLPGQYMVRFVVRDNLTGKVGSVSAPLTVD